MKAVSFCIVLMLVGSASAVTSVYGIFIGVNYADEDGLFGYRGDEAATRLFNAFKWNVQDFHGTLLTGQHISKQDIWEASVQYSWADEDDVCIFYATGHGGNTGVGPSWDPSETETTGDNKMDEFIDIRNTDPYPSGSYWYDDELYSLFLEMAPQNPNKWVLLDTCHSGGFWGDDNPNDYGDLEKLDKIGLLAAAPENGLSYFPKGGGPGLFSDALYDAMSDVLGPLGDHPRADADGDNVVSWDELVMYVLSDSAVSKHLNAMVYELAQGDPTLFTADMWNPVALSSPDLGGTLPVAPPSIPAPAAIGLSSIGACLVAYLRRRRRI